MLFCLVRMLCDLLKFTVCVLFIFNESLLALSQLVNFAISLVSFSSISLGFFPCINRFVSSANIIGKVISETALKSFMYNKNNNGPKIDPIGVIASRGNCKLGILLCVSGNTIINHLMYADDLVLISPSATGMKALLCACEVYSLEHSIVYNSKKSTVLVCRNKAMTHAVCPSFIVNGDVIPESEKVKYLGHIICSDLSDDEDMMRQRRHLYAQGNAISRSFHMCSIAVKNTLFRTFCTPMYTCHLWWNYTAQSFDKLKVAFNNAFRMVQGIS